MMIFSTSSVLLPLLVAQTALSAPSYSDSGKPRVWTPGSSLDSLHPVPYRSINSQSYGKRDSMISGFVDAFRSVLSKLSFQGDSTPAEPQVQWKKVDVATGVGKLYVGEGASVSSCPGLGGNDENPSLTQDQIYAFDKNTRGGLSQWEKNELLCFTPFTSVDYRKFTAIVGSIPTLEPEAGWAFTDDAMSTILGTICTISAPDVRSHYVEFVLSQPGVHDTEVTMVTSAADGSFCAF